MIIEIPIKKNKKIILDLKLKVFKLEKKSIVENFIRKNKKNDNFDSLI